MTNLSTRYPPPLIPNDTIWLPISGARNSDVIFFKWQICQQLQKRNKLKVSKSAETYLTQMQLFLVVGSIKSHRFAILISRRSVVSRPRRHQSRCSRISKVRVWTVLGSSQPAREAAWLSCLLVQPIVEPLQVSRNEPLVQFDAEQRPWNWVCLKSVAAVTTMSVVDDERKQTLRGND